MTVVDEKREILPLGAFPAGLREWAGHRSGGVRRMFHVASGRPSLVLVETPLLRRLRSWAGGIGAGHAGTPRIVLLVGGPGNGKTEAIEEALRALESSLGIDGQLEAHLRPLFSPSDGSVVPRRVDVQIEQISSSRRKLGFTLVQDASVGDPAEPGRTAAALFADDLTEALAKGKDWLFLACVNRGVLDDASILTLETGRSETRAFLDSITRGVGIGPSAPSCWPLIDYPEAAVWPMDVESLAVSRANDDAVTYPLGQVLAIATDAARWPVPGACPAGDRCPFCISGALLRGEPHRGSLLRILRLYELATGKRWSFRDVFTLVSYLLAGAAAEDGGAGGTPCSWAAHLVNLPSSGGGGGEKIRLAAPFRLVASQYQHALFSTWPQLGRNGIRQQLRDLNLDQNPTLRGLHYFLTEPGHLSVPATLRPQLAGLVEVLDPALADPDLEVPVSGTTRVRMREIDERFSHSVREGLSWARKYHFLSNLELGLLRSLADADELVGAAETRRKKPLSAARLQVVLRDFSCRLVRRSAGTRSGVVRDLATLSDFERVVGGDDQLLHHAMKQVDFLLNERDRFTVTLNTTFGEPMPPLARRVQLETTRQKVRAQKPDFTGRPAVDIRYLNVGPDHALQHIPLTYELFRSVREIQNGMLTASLPRPVVASLDATRAKLAGAIVRDEEQLDGAEIHIGLRDEYIVREMGTFLIRRKEIR